ncbi:AAA family ATPase [Campylobacter geochelonis]|uniref:Recombination protein F n=1 Tax=Campylobacter geochelonis TaxID=1780362 RepID=A0A128EGN9_9BACT|nr:AAA family ATPase [Campylobacter geochelonis]QKF70845.1 ATP-binding protein (AAA domain) [Campylobacter geochelonis]CZE48026.1 recombination protein F [Campylobacter geochelonis]
MIIGILLKNYKIYGGLNYIPISTKHRFSAYIGDNGVGKSSILEALDTYFNGKEWNIHSGASLTDANTPYISTVHLLDKESLKKITKNDESCFKKMQKISDLLWDFDISKLSPNSTEAKILIEELKNIDSVYKDTHMLLISGVGYKHSIINVYFSSFDSHIAKLFSEELGGFKFNSQNEEENKKFRIYFGNYNEYIKNYYSYIYIPVEAGVEEFTKLETQNMQKLMGKDINDEIIKIITTKNLDTINKSLNSFVDDLEQQLSAYTYKNGSNRKNISMNELTQKVIELFFSIRTLHKIDANNKNISAKSLSSGEKRQALIDISTALIKSQTIEDKEIILAIDEPESSLNISKTFNQFQKLLDLSTENLIQTLITTHWYGFLPITTSGNAHFLSLNMLDENKTSFKFRTFDLYNYREKIKQNSTNKPMPDEIELKSINDLVQSIIASIKSEKPYNWLICEGSSEKIYFDFYMSDLIEKENLRILPVGGSKEVQRINNYLILPLNEKEGINGKIYCLVDTDKIQINFNNGNSDNIIAKRLFNDEKQQDTLLVKIDGGDRSQVTEIEDCLNGELFIETLRSFQDKKINTILDQPGNIRTDSNSYFCFDIRPTDKKDIKEFFKKNNGFRKIEFARKYVELAQKKKYEVPKFIDEIIDFFKLKHFKN